MEEWDRRFLSLPFDIFALLVLELILALEIFKKTISWYNGSKAYILYVISKVGVLEARLEFNQCISNLSNV